MAAAALSLGRIRAGPRLALRRYRCWRRMNAKSATATTIHRQVFREFMRDGYLRRRSQTRPPRTSTEPGRAPSRTHCA